MQQRIVWSLLFWGAIPALGQNPSDSLRADWSSYYPLAIGNYWEYDVIGTGSGQYSLEVMGDTLMPNGHVYYIMRQAWRGQRSGQVALHYERIIPQTGDVFRYDTRWVGRERLWHSIAAPIQEGVVWAGLREGVSGVSERMVRVTCVSEGLELDFGLEREYRRCKVQPGRSGPLGDLNTYTKEIGVTGIYHDYYESLPGVALLKYARINGQAFGQPIGTATEHPEQVSLGFHAYPMPFQQSTTLTFNLDRPQHIRVDIIDVLGRQVTMLKEGYVASGTHHLVWRADGMPSGIYFARLVMQDHHETKTLILSR